MANTKKNNFTEHSRVPECCVKGDANGCDCAICSWDPRSSLKDQLPYFRKANDFQMPKDDDFKRLDEEESPQKRQEKSLMNEAMFHITDLHTTGHKLPGPEI